MCFAADGLGMRVILPKNKKDVAQTLLSEQVGILLQTTTEVASRLTKKGIDIVKIGTPIKTNSLDIKGGTVDYSFDIATYRKHWFKSSYLLDRKQSGTKKANERFDTFDKTIKLKSVLNNSEGISIISNCEKIIKYKIES